MFKLHSLNVRLMFSLSLHIHEQLITFWNVENESDASFYPALQVYQRKHTVEHVTGGFQYGPASVVPHILDNCPQMKKCSHVPNNQ